MRGRPRRAPETFLLVSSRIGRGVSITSPRTGPARLRRRRRRRPSRPSRGRREYSRAGIRRRPPRAPRPVSSCTRRGRRRSPRGRSRLVLRQRHRRRPYLYRRRPRSSSSRRGCDETKRRRRRRVARTRRRARSRSSDAGVTSPWRCLGRRCPGRHRRVPCPPSVLPSFRTRRRAPTHPWSARRRALRSHLRARGTRRGRSSPLPSAGCRQRRGECGT